MDAVAACIDELHEAGHLDGVELVATSCFWHSIMGTDRAGAPVTPMLTWADARATPVAARLRSRTDPAFPRYPRLPVTRCRGYEPRHRPGAAFG